MIQRWKIYGNQAAAVTEPDGEYVEYTDHLAAMKEKDAKIAKREADAEKWAGIAGQNQKQINKLADEIERLKVVIADLTLGCMDNVEIRTAKHHFTGMNLAIDEDLLKEDSDDNK